MAEITDADRERARAAIKAASPEVYVDEYVIDGELPPLIETVAAALAEERAKARAPFLAFIDRLERSVKWRTGGEPSDMFDAERYKIALAFRHETEEIQ